MDSKKKSFLKSISWRVIGSCSTFAVSYSITNSLTLSSGIASLEAVAKIVIFYVHERVWERIKI